MHLIDRYAYANRLRDVDPAYKAGIALVTLLLCLILSEPLVGMVAIVGMGVLAVCVAAIPAGVFGRILCAEAVFLLLTTIGVALSITGRAPTSADWAWQAGPLWVSSSRNALTLAARLLTRALGGAAAMNLLALTTPLVDMVELLQRLGLPRALSDIITVMYRYIFVLLESLDRMRTAQESRLGYGSIRRGLASAGLLASRLFIEAFQHSKDLQMALEARGYEGELHVLPSTFHRNDALLWAGLAVTFCQLGVWWAV